MRRDRKVHDYQPQAGSDAMSTCAREKARIQAVKLTVPLVLALVQQNSSNIFAAPVISLPSTPNATKPHAIHN